MAASARPTSGYTLHAPGTVIVSLSRRSTGASPWCASTTYAGTVIPRCMRLSARTRSMGLLASTPIESSQRAASRRRPCCSRPYTIHCAEWPTARFAVAIARSLARTTSSHIPIATKMCEVMCSAWPADGAILL